MAEKLKILMQKEKINCKVEAWSVITTHEYPRAPGLQAAHPSECPLKSA